MKKILLTTGSLMAVVSSASAISCSTSWTSWIKNDTKEKEFDYTKYVQENDPSKHPLSYQVRKTTTLDKLAYTIKGDNITIKLDQINNVNEFVYVLKKVLNSNLQVDLDQYWNDLTDNDPTNDKRLLDYINNIPSILKIKLVLGNVTSDVDWDITDYKIRLDTTFNEALTIRGTQADVDNYLASLPQDDIGKKLWNTQVTKPNGVTDKTWEIHQMKKYDIQVDGINAKGTPNKFVRVAKAGIDFLNLDVVQPLVTSDPTYSLKLSKLVNLPGDARNTNPKGNVFASLKEFLSTLGSFLNSVFSSDAVTKWNDVKTLRDTDGKLYKVNNDVYYISKKDYSLSEVIENGKSKQTRTLVGQNNKTIFIAKIMNKILKK